MSGVEKVPSMYNLLEFIYWFDEFRNVIIIESFSSLHAETSFARIVENYLAPNVKAVIGFLNIKEI